MITGYLVYNITQLMYNDGFRLDVQLVYSQLAYSGIVATGLLRSLDIWNSFIKSRGRRMP